MSSSAHALVKDELTRFASQGKISAAAFGIEPIMRIASGVRSHHTSFPIFSPVFFISLTRTRLCSSSSSAQVMRDISYLTRRRKDGEGDQSAHWYQGRVARLAIAYSAPSAC